MSPRSVTIGGYPCLVGGDGRPLVILPGLIPAPGPGSLANRVSHHLTARVWTRSRRTYYVARRPGMPVGITMAEVAAEHAAVLRDAFDGPVDLLGVSTGGSVAQQLAAEHPEVVRRLVLISTACRPGALAQQVQREVAVRVRAGALRQARARYGAELFPPGVLEVAAAAAGWLLGPALVSGGALADLATMIEAEDGFDLAELNPIVAPTLVVAGGRDRYYGETLFTETAELIPGSRLEVYPREGHVSVMSHPGVVRQVLRFLA